MREWKERAIKELKLAKTKDEARKIAQKACKENCRVVNYNYHCERCRLVKALLTLIGKLPKTATSVQATLE